MPCHFFTPGMTVPQVYFKCQFPISYTCMCSLWSELLIILQNLAQMSLSPTVHSFNSDLLRAYSVPDARGLALNKTDLASTSPRPWVCDGIPFLCSPSPGPGSVESEGTLASLVPPFLWPCCTGALEDAQQQGQEWQSCRGDGSTSSTATAGACGCSVTCRYLTENHRLPQSGPPTLSVLTVETLLLPGRECDELRTGTVSGIL